MNLDLTEYQEENHKNYNIASPVPDVCKTEPCVLGVDEAGRGPVLGPMVYGICYAPLAEAEILKELGCADSKTLNEKTREELFAKLCRENNVGFALELVSPTVISNCMYKREKFNLNELSHSTAIKLIRDAITAGVNVKELYVDTVGVPEKYQARLEREFPAVKVTVSKKADSLFPIVSAASIVAKVSRDRALKEWKFKEGVSIGMAKTDECGSGSGDEGDAAAVEWGSGYPGDPVTKKFLRDHCDKVFGFPQLVRFSWSTAEKIIQEKCVTATWDEVDEENSQSRSLLNYFSFGKKQSSAGKGKGGRQEEKETSTPALYAPPIKRHRFFRERGLSHVTSFF